jgi:chemotaxis-related protein WspB
MPALLFEIEGQRYGLDFAQVVKVLPALRLRPIPHAPDYVSGIFQYQGKLVPVIDLSRLIRNRTAPAILSTRIILVRLAGSDRLLGLLAERATDSWDGHGTAPQSTGIDLPEAPYLGGLSTSGEGMIQFVAVENLLPDELKDRLFKED